MFQSLNLFKPITCPFYIQNINNKTVKCERPYCQFKHPTISTITSNKDIIQSTNKDTATSTESTNKISTQKENNETINDIKQLPNVLENLSTALQSVQKLISSSNIPNIGNLSELVNSSASSSDSDTINSSLKTLTSAINSLSSENKNLTKKKDSQKSPVNNLKRQQLNAPAYNPTPIKELKISISNEDLNYVDDDDDVTEIEPPKRRKKNDPDDVKIIKTEKKSIYNESVEKKTPITKVNDELNKKSQNSSTGTTQKTDLVPFAKLSLSQQVQRRYEMLNKTAPTPMSLAESRLKKIQGILGSSSTSKNGISSKTGTTTPQKVPRLIIDNTNKIPLVMRQRYLTVIFDNGRLSFSTLEKACEKAAEQEKSIYDRAKNKTIYTNLAANLVRGLRNAQTQNASPSNANATTASKSGTMSLKNDASKKTTLQSQSHEAMLNGHKANRCTFSINRVKQVEAKDLSTYDLYKMFCTYLMTENQFVEHSFPKWIEEVYDSKFKFVMIPNYQKKNLSNKLDEAKKLHIEKQSMKTETAPNLITKLCKRCSRTFLLSAKELNYLNSNSECIHHWGKLRNVRVDKSVVQKYICCNGGPNETGCEVGRHVYEGENDGNGTGMNLKGYVETKPSKSENRKTSENIFALDCEMCYTTRGLEITRVSVVDIHLKEVYESLVKPDTQILDYNTRWSGINEKILKNCTQTLKTVQMELLEIINKDSIIIGHSLDSDFKSLKLVHKKVIDTSVVFPHKLGLPYKRALRNLMSEHLQKIIQEDVEGHDSKEDANSCIQLLMWKINEDLKNPKKLASALSSADSNPTTQFSTVKSKSSSSSVSPFKRKIQ